MIEVLLFGMSDNRGGIETYLKKIWDNIDKTRFHFNFIDMNGSNKKACFYDELSQNGASFYKITPRRESAIKNRKDLNRLFKEHHFDIFHFNVNTLSYLLPVEIALKNGSAVVVHSRNGGTSNRVITRVLHAVNKKRLQKMHVTRIAVSPMAGEWLFGKSKFDVYYNGVQTEKFKYTDENRKRIRAEQKCENKLVIGNVSVFTPAKNHRFMIDVFEKIKERNPDSSLWFVGDGVERANIEQYIAEKGLQSDIKLLGRRSDVPEIYAALDLFLFPSTFEGFGNVLLEAECEGVPCLISDCIPQDALIMDNTAVLSLDESLECWADKIMEMSQKQKTDRSKCNEEIEKTVFSVKSEICRIEELYIQMLKNKSGDVYGK